MEPWYKVATPRREVREGRSFNPDEFAIALEQVVAGNAPEDYQDPTKFFARTCFTRALREYSGLVLRRLQGKTESTAPVLTLVTQFGGGKTHTLTTLYHIAKNGKALHKNKDTSDLLSHAELPIVENVRVAVFVGNAWDPREGRENPWIDIARQLAGEKGVAELGQAAKTTPPGTEALHRVFQAANGPILILMDEVLNFFNRHRPLVEPTYAFFDNLNRAMTGTTHGAMVISLPRSQVEMTDWDTQWQERITKVVRRVAKELIANDETEISEVVRRRLFEDLGSEKARKNVAKTFADWCFERRAQLPPEWTAVDTSATDAKSREFLQKRFEDCYPFHPATLSVFQRKWQALQQYQQTRGTLAMFAQWISIAAQESFKKARTEPLITLGSAPLEVPEFRSVVLGQIGEARLATAIDSDLAGAHSHAKALDADTKGPLRDIHRRVGAAILFESSGGHAQKVAHLPELRFALGEPSIDTTSVDSAAFAMEASGYYVRKVGTDGFQIHHQATLKKVVSDRRASLDQESEVKPTMRDLVRGEFRRGAGIPVIDFPNDGAEIQDSPKLTIITMDPELEWIGKGSLRVQVAEWTKQRGKSPRLYPGSLVWCFKKPGRELRDDVENWLAWKRVAQELANGTLGSDFDKSDRSEVQARVKIAEDTAREEVWGGYRYVVLSDPAEKDGLKVIDLGAGHASASETLCGRVIAALKSQALLNESVGAGYLDRHWPPALKKTGGWPLASLRQSFLNGALTRLVDPDLVLRAKVVEFVGRAEFGLASGQKKDGSFERIWFEEMLPVDEVNFDEGVFLLTRAKAKELKGGGIVVTSTPTGPTALTTPPPTVGPTPHPPVEPVAGTRTIRLVGDIPPELWNRLGTKILPKLRSGDNLKVGVEFTVTVKSGVAPSLESDLRQILADLGLTNRIRIE
ncbi:MAG: ATP-binding protein [Nitrospirae bacterium]|nr:ATP-binding protein [Nitrospirota bacterium]